MNERSGLKIVFLMCVGIFLCMLDTTIMNITLPVIQLDLSTSLEKMSWVLNIYTMSIAVFSIPLGRVADLFGKAKMFILGLLIFGIGSSLCAFATTVNFLIVSRFIQSIGAAILFPTSMVIGVSSVSLHNRNTALSILGVTQGLSAALGPVIGGVITENLGWKWVFLVNVPICIIGLVLGIKMLNIKNEEKVKAKIDWIGLFLISTTLLLITEALIKVGQWGWSDYKFISCILISIFTLSSFIFVEKKINNPMINLKLFKDRQFVGASLSVILSNLFLVGVTVLLPTFLTRLYGKTEIQAALMITPISGMIFLISPLSALLLQKLSKITVIMSGFIFMACSYYWLELIDIHTNYIGIIIPCILLGVGYGLIVGPVTILAASSFEGELLTASQSVISVLRQLGIVLAIAIFVSSLSNNLTERKQDVYSYAEKKVDSLNVTKDQKDKILKKTISEIHMNSLGESKPTILSTSSNQFISNYEKQKIINLEITKDLKNLPSVSKNRNNAEKEIRKQVEKKITIQNEEISSYIKNVANYSKNILSTGFTDLYKTSAPIVLICSLVSILFYQRRLLD